MRLGKKEAQRDARNLKLQAVLRPEAPTPPESYDFDRAYGGFLESPMFANDRLGCCVIAGRAHQTLRLELKEQGGLIGIDDNAVVNEYLTESGGADDGLYTLESLKTWRTRGWLIGWTTYKIKAFAEVNLRDREAVKAAIYGACGIGLGLSLPLTAEVQFANHAPWLLGYTDGDGAPGSWGGHYVYCPGYNATGPVAISWGRRVQMTWGFMTIYGDEAYAITDDRTPGYRSAVIDTAKVDNFLAAL